MKSLNYILPLLLISAGCNPDDEKVFKGGSSESKPVTTLLNGTEGVTGFDATAEVKTAATVTYIMKVTSESGAALCEGEATIKIMSNFSMSFPKAEIDCVSLKVNLAKALEAGGGIGGGDPKEAQENIVHDGKVLSLKKLANANFDPPRPMLLGPIIQDVSKYKNFKQTTKHSLTGTDPESGVPVSGTGSFNIEVLDYKTTYKNKYLDEEFENVIHWQMTTSGFKDVPAKIGLIFERWEWLWNVRPIMIPKLSFTGRLSDFISGDAGANADALVGILKIDLTVKEYTINKE